MKNGGGEANAIAAPAIGLPVSADDWIERHLYTWARWMRRGELTEGFADHCSGGLQGFTHMDMDAAYERLDAWIAAAVDACMEELPPAEWAAVRNRHGLAVFEFPRDNEAELYASAKKRLIPMLRRRNVQ